MDGEDLKGSESPQPGGRPPAPGELALVQAFINSHYDLEFSHGAELLSSPVRLHSYLRRSGLVSGEVDWPTRFDVGRAIRVRECLRQLARANGHRQLRGSAGVSPAALNELSVGALLEVQFDPGGRARLIPVAEHAIDQAIASLLAITATAMVDGTWSRLKVCPGHDCGWAFYDHSRNQSGRWCSMSVCGGRSKARAHYRRRQVTGD